MVLAVLLALRGAELLLVVSTGEEAVVGALPSMKLRRSSSDLSSEQVCCE